MYNHNRAQQSKNRVHISWDILYVLIHLFIIKMFESSLVLIVHFICIHGESTRFVATTFLRMGFYFLILRRREVLLGFMLEQGNFKFGRLNSAAEEIYSNLCQNVMPSKTPLSQNQ